MVVVVQMNLCRANACQSAVKVTQCLLVWPEVTSQRCRLTKRLFPARSLRCTRWTHFGVFSEFRLRCGNALLCLFKAKVSGGSDRCDVADSTFLHHTHTHFDPQRNFSLQNDVFDFISLLHSCTLKPNELAANLISSLRVPQTV